MIDRLIDNVNCVLNYVAMQVWPEDALEMVANNFLEDVDLENEVRSETVTMCKHFHESVRVMSQLYYAELLRYNYVTPTSYLELILTFKKLLSIKREDIQMLRNRYVTGLDKLDFAASQVVPTPSNDYCCNNNNNNNKALLNG